MKDVANKIKNAGGNLYLVGGAVRDKIMQNKVKDEDYCVVGLDQTTFERLFPNFHIRGKDFAVYDIEGKEIALARKEKKYGQGHKNFKIDTDKSITIYEDLARRDITINSMAQDVLTGEIIDPYGGQKDIQNRVIKMTSSAFCEDPLRVYRVARFSAVLNFSVDSDTIKQMQILKNELNTLSAERVFDEFRKALQSEHPSIFFDVLRQAEILDVHFKEIYDLIYSKENNYDSTMLALDASTKLTDKLEVRYSCLAHHFGEEEKGVGLVSKLGKRLKIPNLWTECAKVAVKQHIEGEKFYEVTPEKQLDFIEKVHKSKLGLKGMKIVVMCDKYKDGAFPKNVNFDILGENCIKSINGKYIKDKYGIEEGIYLKQKLYEERINWLKNINI